MRLQAPRPALALGGSSLGRGGGQEPLALAETKTSAARPLGTRRRRVGLGRVGSRDWLFSERPGHKPWLLIWVWGPPSAPP